MCVCVRARLSVLARAFMCAHLHAVLRIEDEVCVCVCGERLCARARMCVRACIRALLGVEGEFWGVFALFECLGV